MTWSIILNSIEFFLSGIILILSFGIQCSTPLNWWLLVFMMRIQIMLCWFLICRRFEILKDKVWYGQLLILLWYTIGQCLLYSSIMTCRQTNPILWYYVFGLSLFYMILIPLQFCFHTVSEAEQPLEPTTV